MAGQPPEQEPPKSRWRRLKGCLGIILIIALLAALGSGGYSMHQVLQIQTTYEKIGSTKCDGAAGTSTVFTGLTMGFVTETGATEYKCVSTDDDIQIQYYNDTFSVYNNAKEQVKFLNVTKYKTFRTGILDFEAACSKCSVSGRGVIDMVPGRIDCIDKTWTKEYNGYLMTDNGSTSFSCVDLEMEVGEIHTEDTPILRHVVKTNTVPGYFQSNKVLSCVVCSK